jgi:hypothetical protein
MSEALTPHLSREEYIKRYIQSLQAEEANINFNFAANQQFENNGETLGVIADQSRTLVNVPMAQLKPQVARMFQGVILNPEAGVAVLTDDEVRFAYQAYPQIVDLIRKSYPRTPIESLMLKPIVRDLLAQASVKPQLPARADDPEAAGARQAPPAPPAPPADRYYAPAGGPVEDYGSIVQYIEDKIKEGKNLSNLRIYLEDQYKAKKIPESDLKRLRLQIARKQAELGKKQREDEAASRGPLEDVKEQEGYGGLFDTAREFYDSMSGNSSGSGLRHKRKPIVRGRGMLAPVGAKHYIEVGNLKNGYVSLRNSSGRQIENKVKVGGNVGNAIKSVLEGKNIDVQDADTMNDEERSYLNHLGKKTGEHRFHLKLRNKTAAEKLEHEFEILRGQLVAGNDSPEIIKDFKKVIIKLRNMNKLSKPVVGDLLLELTAYE